jgi:serine/threonine protein kinase
MSGSSSVTAGTPEEDLLLHDVIEEVSRKLQAGEPVDMDAYVRAHPECADQLRKVLPAVAVLADLGRSAAPGLPFGPEAGAGLGELGDYRIVREVGRGGMGVVYEARQLSLNRRVALKVLPFAATLDPRQLRRFHNEAQAAAGLHHTSIVPIYSVGVERGVHYYAMQFVDGRSLAEAIRDLHRLHDREAPAADRPPDSAPSPLSPGSSIIGRAFFQEVARLGIQAAEALEYAHSLGVVHRDIKPANLLLDDRGNLWVADFGLARVHAEAGLTMTGDVLGTLRYMSPEQALARRGLVDHRTDVYSLGVTLYELLTLRPALHGRDRQELLRQIAFEEPPPARQNNPAIPRELETIVLKAMAKEPPDRYAVAQELADDLRRFLEHKPILARRPTWPERVVKWSRRHAAAVGTAALVLLVGVVGLAVSNRMIARRNAEIVRRSAEVVRQRDEIKRALKESEG